MKQSLTGRDAKVIVQNAIEHLEALLEFAHKDEAEILQEVQAVQGGTTVTVPVDARVDVDEEAFDWEEEVEELNANEPESDDQREDDDDNLRRIQRDARAWDAFLSLVHAMRPFERDDIEYRKARAVETFDAAADTSREYKRLHPAAVSACPHVALCVLPRQQVEHGDHGRRGADHSEAFGASIKDRLHRRTLRRKLGKKETTHTKLNADNTVAKTWVQGPLKVSRIMQAFRDSVVTERILRDEKSVKYLQRKHHRVQSTGFATVAQAAASTALATMPSGGLYNKISQKAEEGRSLA